ncbi:MAG: type II toxin-antitoxin system PemK/MazF family toxin [Rothia sp. (in: high G+C Gram-positive bacteria)]|nr:type II toxin-antitoxin system PemK/MazF family toxin [Rothia sp. (in: high G+C Gram-positive bacteria)]
MIVADTQFGEKYFVVVSNNLRNKNLGDFLCVRVTSSDKSSIALPSIVAVPASLHECVHGFILCDDIEIFYDDEIKRYLGALSPAVMDRVNAGLRSALAL